MRCYVSSIGGQSIAAQRSDDSLQMVKLKVMTGEVTKLRIEDSSKVIATKRSKSDIVS